VVRQRAVGMPPDGRPAIGRAAGDRGPQVVHGPGKRTAAGRLVRAVAGRQRVRPVRVVRGARPEHGPERGAGADVRGRGGRAQAPGPPVVDAHVHHHARFVRLVPHVDGHAVADGRHDQHGRARRVVCRRRAPGKHIIMYNIIIILLLYVFVSRYYSYVITYQCTGEFRTYYTEHFRNVCVRE